MSIKKYILIFIILLNTLSYGNEFERTEELPYLSVTNVKLIEDANSIFTYISSINGKNVKTNGTIELSRNGISTTLDLPVIKEDIKLFPIKSYEAKMYIIANKNATIKTFSIYLNDILRQISATGNNLDNVVATLNVAKEKLEKHEVSFTGRSFRFFLFLLIIIVIIVTIYFTSKLLDNKQHNIFLAIVFISSQFALYGLDWEQYFPGFQASINTITLLERYSPLLSLIGVLLTIIIPLITFMNKTTNK